ncbi:hypothetical protein [Nocardioides mesophilus]|uniref:Uncharacterized protein n=1 Tax=Nocardioides mesophilus TaxID=433659 RepID=A0A7G9R7Y3_9ACTN|nr:hypothetical protein [Nocardioides mesophilus]QNN51708.1 hypothetical protein H9L09_14210 [Nocardioides mesophilus]
MNDQAAATGLGLVRADDRSEAVAALVQHVGRRVGLQGVLADLNRTGRVGPVPASAAVWGFRLQAEDDHSPRWWPQGITTSGDANADGQVGGRSVVLTSAYSKEVNGLHMGSRITVTDVTEPNRVRYRHVLLVEALEVDGQLELRPVKVHAGGLVWHGRHLHVAATARGLATFRLDDILEVPRSGAAARFGLGADGALDAFGHRYVLPLRFRYVAEHAAAVAPMRYSFLSLERDDGAVRLVAGEYGRDGATTRLLRYAIDPASRLPAEDWLGRSRPLEVEVGVDGMQGAVVVGGRHYLSTSAGPSRHGSIWVGTPDALERRPGVLPVGPEDLSYAAATDRIWCVSEYPRHRYVFAMDRSRLD